MMMKDHIFPGNCFERILITNSKIGGPRFRSILSSTLAWSKWLFRRTIHKYERFFSDKASSENHSLECPVFELPS
jgi:hypothetical protein